MELKLGHKRTDAGLIPSDWTDTHFKECVQSYIDYRGRTPRKLGLDWGGGDILALSANNVQMGRIDQAREANYGSEELYRKWMTQGECERGDIVLTMEAPLGNVAQIPDSRRYILSQRVLLVKPTANVRRDFLACYMRGTGFQRLLTLNATGSTAQGIQRKRLDELPVGIPPRVLEQDAIAETLSDADALIESLEQLIAKKRLIKHGAMQKLLAAEKDWRETSLLELANGRKDLFDDGDWIESEHITDEGVRLVQTGNIGIGRFVETETRKYIFEESFQALGCKEIRSGDLLICRLADPAGRACVLPDLGERKIITSVDVTICRPPSFAANRSFLASVLSTDSWFRAVTERSGGTTHKRISRGALGRIKIRIPSIEEQDAIAHVLGDMDAELATLDSKLTKARQIKQGMMHELLTGRIRLV
jgi:type I restriction enzyme S subunit